MYAEARATLATEYVTVSPGQTLEGPEMDGGVTGAVEAYTTLALLVRVEHGVEAITLICPLMVGSSVIDVQVTVMLLVP